MKISKAPTFLTTALLLAAALLLTTNCQESCSGEFFEQLNFAVLDCRSENGTLLDRTKVFYRNRLQKDCAKKNFGDLSYLDKKDYPGLKDSDNIEVCDFYELGTGYVLTEHDHEIGVRVLQEKVGTDLDTKYREESLITQGYNWKWNELEKLVDRNCQSDQDALLINELWMQLDMDWASLNDRAQEAKDTQTWDKETLHFWVETYVIYQNDFQDHQTNRSNETVGIEGAEPVAEESLTQLDINEIWLPDYNNDNLTTDLIRDSLNQNGFLTSLEDWFVEMFGVNGKVSVFLIEHNDTNPLVILKDVSRIKIPQQIFELVIWLKQNVDREKKDHCPECEQKGGMIGGMGEEVVENVTDTIENITQGVNDTLQNINDTVGQVNQTIQNITEQANATGGMITEMFWNITGYKMPSANCLARNDTQDMCCVTATDSFCVTFEKMNSFWTNDANTTCRRANTIWNRCEDRRTGRKSCYQNDMHKHFTDREEEEIYGWLKFDNSVDNQLYDLCEKNKINMAMSKANFRDMFDDAIGEVN